MTQDRKLPNHRDYSTQRQKVISSSFYGLLGVHPAASIQDIRRAYRDLSKQYHPDTTALPPAIATAKFQQLNEAYATLSSPERRLAYDRKIGYSSIPVVQPGLSLRQTAARPRSAPSSSLAYLDATDRPLSPGEVFALFILGITFIGCLLLAIAIGFTSSEHIVQPATLQAPTSELATADAALTSPQQILPEFDPNLNPSVSLTPLEDAATTELLTPEPAPMMSEVFPESEPSTLSTAFDSEENFEPAISLPPLLFL